MRRLSRRRALAAAALPFVAPSVSGAGDAALRALVAAPASAPLLEPEYAETAVWAYDGGVPGPMLRVRQGDMVRVRLTNQLPEATSVHWHGMRIDNEMDGVAGLTQLPVLPGGGFDYVFQAPDAGTYWYHPHYRSYEQLARGLYGVLIIDEREPYPVDRDVVVLLDDWRVNDDGQIDANSFGHMHDRSHAGRLGNVLTVNGRSYPELQVKAGERVRLRFVNVATARIMAMRIPDHDATLVAVDGQPVTPRGLEDGRFTLAPAQRADVVIDMLAAPGSSHELTMAHRNGDVGAAVVRYAPEPVSGGAAGRPLLALPANDLPAPRLDADALEVEVDIEGGAMGGMRSAVYEGREQDIRSLAEAGMMWALNGVVGRTDTPLFDTVRGRTVVVKLRNRGRWPHGMHFHGHHVIELERNGKPSRHRDWRDTVLLDRNETCKVAFVADNPGRWMLHCHMLDHQAGGMATWFNVMA